MMNSIAFSIGLHARHAEGLQHAEGDFDALVLFVTAPAGETKDGMYIAGPLRDGHRCAESALPLAWAALDLDRIAGDIALMKIVEAADHWQGCAYTTFSHKAEAGIFKLRMIFALDRAVTRPEYKRLCTAIATGLQRAAGVPVEIDTSCSKPEQPLYTARQGAQTWRFDGNPVRVDAALESVPDEPERVSPLDDLKTTDPVLAALRDQGRILRDMGGGKFAIRCPFEAEHSREHTTDDSSTVYLLPHTGGYEHGHFVCKHASCAGRSQSDFRRALKIAGDAASGPTENAWPPPRPIVAQLPPAPPFDAVALLPQVLADYVLDEADRMPCSPDYIAAALIVAFGAVLGSRCALKPKRRDDWIVTPNLFGGCVGDPATKKTPAIDKGLRFLDRLEADEADRLALRTSEYEAELAAHKARESAIEKIMKQAAGGKQKSESADAMDAAVRDLKSLQPPEEPRARRFRTNDATIEKLGDLLSKSPDGILVFRDELVGLLSTWEREGHEADRAFYLEGWNGTGSFAIDRIGRGSLLVGTLNLSVFGGIQPDLLGRYLANIVESSDNDGRIQRFQVLVYPEAVPWEWRDRYPVHGAREKVRDMFLRLAAFDPVQDGATPADDFVKMPHFAFDDAALEVFVEWSTDLHHNVIANEESALLRQHFAKYEKLFCALALILHLAEGRIGPVQADTALRAAAWTQYLAGHARRVYGLLEAQTVTAAQTLATRIAAGKLADGFTARDLKRRGWTGLHTIPLAEAALSILEDFGHVIGVEQDDEPGRPTTRYRINPAILARGKP